MYELTGTAHGTFHSEEAARRCLAQCQDLGVELHDAQIRQQTDPDPTSTRQQAGGTATEASWRKQDAAQEATHPQEARIGGQTP